MPLFARRDHATPATAQPVTTHHGTTRTSGDSNSSGTGAGLFSSRRRTSSLSSSDRDVRTNHKTTSTGLGGIFHRIAGQEDPSLVAARERVQAAEHAEREADRALAAARLSVRDAREHVKALEREASEEARLAKIKQRGAKDLNRRAKPLGRHGH